MVARLLLEPGFIKLSKPGVDVLTAVDEEDFLLGAGAFPQPLLQAGTVAVTTAAAVVVPYGRTLPWRPAFMIQGTQETGEGFVTFPALRTTGGTSGVQTTIAPGLSSLSLTTEYNRTVWYMIFFKRQL